MSLRRRWCVGVVRTAVSFAICVAGVAACREQRPGTSSPPTAEDSSKLVGSDQQPGPGAVAGDKPRVEGVDAADDPRAPACLPKSGAVGQWVKVEPVRFVEAAALGKVVTAEEARRLRHFDIKSAARCTYALGGSAKATRAEVLLVEAASTDDAYGVMSCQCGAQATQPIGGETRVDDRVGYHLHCWQARCYVHIWSDESTAEAANGVKGLLRYIAGNLPRADGPELLEAMPGGEHDPGVRWLLRDLASLSVDALGLASSPDLVAVNRLLGLGEEGTLMCISAYEVPQGRQPNVVWLVRYPTAKAAASAHERYSAHLTRADGPMWASTNLLRPHGRFLIGTWTIEEESLQYMMPRIRQLLPS